METKCRSRISFSQELKGKMKYSHTLSASLLNFFLVLILTFFRTVHVFFGLAYVKYSFDLPKHTVTIWKTDPSCPNEVSDHKILSEAKLWSQWVRGVEWPLKSVQLSFGLGYQAAVRFSLPIPLTTHLVQISRWLTPVHNNASTMAYSVGSNTTAQIERTKRRMAASLEEFR